MLAAYNSVDHGFDIHAVRQCFSGSSEWEERIAACKKLQAIVPQYSLQPATLASLLGPLVVPFKVHSSCAINRSIVNVNVVWPDATERFTS